MSNSRSSSLNILYFHNVSCREVELLLLGSFSARNITNILLVTNEFGGLWIQVSNALKLVPWIERILRLSNGCEFDTLGLSSFDIVNTKSVLNLVQSDVEVSGQ